jgi:hypothetical protein
MTQKTTYCSIPKLFGVTFAAWFEKLFGAGCHIHDHECGIYTAVPRIKADAHFFMFILSIGYKYIGLAIVVFIFVRFAPWRYYIHKDEGKRVPWYYAL